MTAEIIFQEIQDLSPENSASENEIDNKLILFMQMNFIQAINSKNMKENPMMFHDTVQIE